MRYIFFIFFIFLFSFNTYAFPKKKLSLIQDTSLLNKELEERLSKSGYFNSLIVFCNYNHSFVKNHKDYIKNLKGFIAYVNWDLFRYFNNGVAIFERKKEQGWGVIKYIDFLYNTKGCDEHSIKAAFENNFNVIGNTILPFLQKSSNENNYLEQLDKLEALILSDKKDDYKIFVDEINLAPLEFSQETNGLTNLEVDKNKITSYDEKFGVYENLILPTVFEKKLRNSDYFTKSANEVLYRFVKKKNSLEKYPAKAIEGIIWLEVFYNEMLVNEKAVIEEDIVDLWEVRNIIRQNMGFDKSISTQQAIDNYYLLVKVLTQAETKKINNLSPFLKERKIFLSLYKSKYNVAKTIYLRTADIDYKSTKDEIVVASYEDDDENEISETITLDTSNESVEDIGNEVFSQEDNSDELADSSNDRLQELNELFEEGLISEEEYLVKKAEMIFGESLKRLSQLDMLFQEELISKEELQFKREQIHMELMANIIEIEDILLKLTELNKLGFFTQDEYQKYRTQALDYLRISNKGVKERLRELKQLFDLALVNENEYQAIREEILDAL